MGWKTLKEAFQIGHILRVEEKGICIGSGYVHDLVVVDPSTGKVRTSQTFPSFLDEHYPALKNASAEEVLALIQAPDVFEDSIRVYTFEDGEIIEAQCEKLDAPNLTHDGKFMYSNRYSTDLNQVVEWAKRDMMAETRLVQERLDANQRELDRLKERLALAKAKQAALDERYPDIQVPKRPGWDV